VRVSGQEPERATAASAADERRGNDARTRTRAREYARGCAVSRGVCVGATRVPRLAGSRSALSARRRAGGTRVSRRNEGDDDTVFQANASGTVLGAVEGGPGAARGGRDRCGAAVRRRSDSIPTLALGGNVSRSGLRSE